MKAILTSALLAVGALPTSAAVIYLDLGNLTIPNTIDGIYINILDGSTATSEPGTFNTAPWINLFLGGSGISSSAALRPWASVAPGDYDVDANYFINLAPGTTVDSSGLFVDEESGSYLHLGNATDQFVSGAQGYLAFEYDLVGGGVSYGWISVTLNADGEGVSADLVYSDTPGEALVVGAAIPEPSAAAALAGLAVLAGVATRRRRRAA